MCRDGRYDRSAFAHVCRSTASLAMFVRVLRRVSGDGARFGRAHAEPLEILAALDKYGYLLYLSPPHLAVVRWMPPMQLWRAQTWRAAENWAERCRPVVRSWRAMAPKRIDGKAAPAVRPTTTSTRAAKISSPLGRAGQPKKPAAATVEQAKATNTTRPKSAPTRPEPPPSRDGRRHSDDSSTQKCTGSPAARWPRPKSSQRRGSGSRQPRPVSASRIGPIHPLPSDELRLPSLTVMPAAGEWLRCTLLAPAWVAVRLDVVAGPEGATSVRLAACHAVAGMWGSCRADAAYHPTAPAWLRRGATPSRTSESGGDGGGGGGGGTGDPDDEESGGAANGGSPSESPLSSAERHALRLLFKGCDAVSAQLLPPSRPGAYGARAEHVLVWQLVESCYLASPSALQSAASAACDTSGGSAYPPRLAN